MNPQEKWICDGEPKYGKQYANSSNPHQPHENIGPDCEICGLPREAMIPPKGSRGGLKPIAAAILVALVAIAGVGVYYAFNRDVLISKSSRFYCELRPDSKQEGTTVYTVMYRHDRGRNPWLKMVSTLGENWPPEVRCQEIARRLEGFRQDGLKRLTFQEDPQLKQYIICAQTKASGEQGCPLLITLKPGANPVQTLNDMTEALVSKSDLSSTRSISLYQGTNGGSPPSNLGQAGAIDLTPYLADEDKRAGE